MKTNSINVFSCYVYALLGSKGLYAVYGRRFYGEMHDPFAVVSQSMTYGDLRITARARVNRESPLWTRCLILQATLNVDVDQLFAQFGIAGIAEVEVAYVALRIQHHSGWYSQDAEMIHQVRVIQRRNRGDGNSIMQMRLEPCQCWRL
jgi:hypothetical protein